MKNLRSLLALLFLAVVGVLSLGIIRQSFVMDSNDELNAAKSTVITTQASIGSEHAD